jgi:hypothetical protein
VGRKIVNNQSINQKVAAEVMRKRQQENAEDMDKHQ